MIRSLVHLRDTYPRRKKIARELKYFRRNRHRMRYAALKEQGLPIGSGVTEAACKTLSNATHEEVRNAMGRARRPSHSILPRSRAEQSLRASLDPARTYLQGGGYDSRQCRADTQLAMIGVSMRVTPIVKPTALSPVANTDTKLLIYSLFQKGRVLAQDGEQRVLSRARYCVGGPAATECRISTEAKTSSQDLNSHGCLPVNTRSPFLRVTGG